MIYSKKLNTVRRFIDTVRLYNFVEQSPELSEQILYIKYLINQRVQDQAFERTAFQGKCRTGVLILNSSRNKERDSKET